MKELFELTENDIFQIFKTIREKQLNEKEFLDLDELCDLNTDEFSKIMTECFISTKKEINSFDKALEYF